MTQDAKSRNGTSSQFTLDGYVARLTQGARPGNIAALPQAARRYGPVRYDCIGGYVFVLTQRAISSRRCSRSAFSAFCRTILPRRTSGAKRSRVSEFSIALRKRLNTGPDRRDTERQVLVRATGAAQAGQAHRLRLGRAGREEASVGNHVGKLALRREALNRLDEVLVRVAVADEQLAQRGDDREGVLLVHSG